MFLIQIPAKFCYAIGKFFNLYIILLYSNTYFYANSECQKCIVPEFKPFFTSTYSLVRETFSSFELTQTWNIFLQSQLPLVWTLYDIIKRPNEQKIRERRLRSTLKKYFTFMVRGKNSSFCQQIHWDQFSNK